MSDIARAISGMRSALLGHIRGRLRWSGRADCAEDLVQEVLCLALESAACIDPEHVEATVWAIEHRAVRAYLRSDRATGGPVACSAVAGRLGAVSGRDGAMVALPPVGGLADQVLGEMGAEQWMARVNSLPPTLRAAMVAHIEHGRAAAKALGISDTAQRKRLQRARAILARCLSDERAV